MRTAFASIKGGTGKTTLALMLAKAAGRALFADMCPGGETFKLLKPEIEKEINFYRTMPVIDLEKCTFCETCARECPYLAIFVDEEKQIHELYPEICRSCGVCAEVCPEKGAIIEEERKKGIIRMGRKDSIEFIDGILSGRQYSAAPMIREIRQYAMRYRALTIFDVPSGSSFELSIAVENADFVIIPAVPDIPGKAALARTVEILRDIHKNIAIIINKTASGSDIIKNYAEMEEIPVLGEIPFDHEIEIMNSRGEIPFEKYSEQFKDIIENIPDELLI